ncbi:MAG: hypothetical protein KGJ84_13150 [Elusimicrobia bacterium]|nr:hypothetical protein [Elusimicrobiota bacterium]
MDSSAVEAAWLRIQVSAFRPASDPPPPQHSADEVSLGQALFFDADLSKDKSLSCATCHIPSRSWTDGLPRARGKGIGAARKELARNTISLLNVRLRHRFFWDGRAARVQDAALIAAANPEEMDTPPEVLAKKIARSSKYSKWFARVYPRRRITPDLVGEAFAAFVETVPRANPSPFDRFSTDPDALSPLQKEGLVLFTGKAHCLRCHNGPSLSDNSEHSIGLKADGAANPGANPMMVTPPLRNLGETAPYMHNGTLATLADVVDFYDRGGDTGAGQALTGQDPDIVPLMLSAEEKKALVAFLESLGDIPPPPAQRSAQNPPAHDASQAAPPSAPERYDSAQAGAQGFAAPSPDPESDEDRACVKSFTFEKFVSHYFKPGADRQGEGELLELLASHQAAVANKSDDLSLCDVLAPKGTADDSMTVQRCRQDALHMMRIKDLVSRNPRFLDTCGMHMPELADYGKAACAAILSHIDEPARLCALLAQDGTITPKQTEACVFHFSAYTRFREPNYCETLDPPRFVREECHDVVGFARASASGRVDDCGDSEFCRDMLDPDAIRESLSGIRDIACLMPRR